MKIAICEDERIFSEKLAEYIKEWANLKNISVEIFEYASAESFLYEWAKSEDLDIIFLDIKMKKMNGLELAQFIRKTNNDIHIIFTTNMKNYVFSGYSVSAMQYLLKPVSKKDCIACLDKGYKLSTIKKYYIYQDSDKTIRIPISDIIYIEMLSHNATIFTQAQNYTFRKTISQILEELNDEVFIKCHKSYIVNISHIESVSKNFLSMSNGKEISVSKNMINQINEKFIQYNTNKM